MKRPTCNYCHRPLNLCIFPDGDVSFDCKDGNPSETDEEFYEKWKNLSKDNKDIAIWDYNITQ